MSEVAQLKKAEADFLALGPMPYALPLGPRLPAVAGVFAGAEASDWVLTGPRERIGAALRGCTPSRLIDPAAGARPYKLAPCTMHPGARALHAVGLALGTQAPTICVLGLASAASGDFYEALNCAALTQAPVVFVVLTAQLGEQAPVGPQVAAAPATLAQTLGITAHTVEATFLAVRDAVATARAGGGPALIEAQLISE